MAIVTENLYLVKFYNDYETFYKIGTTVHRYCRFYQIMKLGYEAEIVYMLNGVNPNTAWESEHNLISLFNDNRYNPMIKFGGYTECFNYIDIEKYKSAITHIKFNEKVENIHIQYNPNKGLYGRK